MHGCSVAESGYVRKIVLHCFGGKCPGVYPFLETVEECIYGIQASGDTKLSSIVRAIDDDIRPIYTEKRLSRNLDDETVRQFSTTHAGLF